MVHLEDSRIVFLLGAGASKDAGLPLATDMTDRLIHDVDDSGDENMKRLLSLVLGGIHFLRGYQGRFPQPRMNIEDVVSTVDMLRSRYTSLVSPFVGAWNDQLGLFDRRSDGRDYLNELYDMAQQKVKTWLLTPPMGDIRYFEAFRDFVKAFKTPPDVFTLNYDLCLEVALKHSDIAFTTGFTKYGWDASEFGQEIVRIYKLHGSLAWYRDEEDQTIYSTLVPPDDRIPMTEYPPLLVFGTTSKLQAIDPFLTLSYMFSEKVKAAQVIAVIGYGFGDDYINKMIQQSLARDNRKRIVVVGYDERDSRDNMCQRFPAASSVVEAGRVTFLGGGTAHALTKGTLLDSIRTALEEATEEGPF